MSYLQSLKGQIGRISKSFAEATAPIPGATDTTIGIASTSEVTVSTRRPISRHVIFVAASMWLATRVAYIALTYFAAALIQNKPQTAHSLLQPWQQFDGNWYIQIAQQGYFSIQSTAFFPLYPMLIHALTFVLGDAHRLLAAMMIANLGALVGFIGLGLLAAQDDGDDSAAARAIRVVASFPFAFFMFAPYTDGTFLGFAALAFLCARRGSWKWAALWAFLAGATRPTGVILIPALFWEFGRQQGWWRRDVWLAGRWREALRSLLRVKPLSDLVLALGAVPLALGLFVIYCGLTLGHPLATFNSHRVYWSRIGAPLWQTFAHVIANIFAFPFGSRPPAMILLDLGAVLLCAVVTLATIRKAPFAYTIYMAGLIYLSTSTPNPYTPVMIDAAGRFMLTAFPVWLVLGRWIQKRPWLDMFLVSFGFLLQTVCILLYFSKLLIE